VRRAVAVTVKNMDLPYRAAIVTTPGIVQGGLH
jgi:hypothetical protein